ncbi:hypothetical protein JCM10207_007095 [Rhodosporidiobolus poonsookiae]
MSASPEPVASTSAARPVSPELGEGAQAYTTQFVTWQTELYDTGSQRHFTRTGFISSCFFLLWQRYSLIGIGRPRTDNSIEIGCSEPDCSFAAAAVAVPSEPQERVQLSQEHSDWYHSHGRRATTPLPEAQIRERWSQAMSEARKLFAQPKLVVPVSQQIFTRWGQLMAPKGKTWEIAFTATTSSPAMLRLVQDRDAVFDLQRKLQDSPLQLESQRCTLEYLSTADAVSASLVRVAARVCQALDIPLFPLTPALVALLLYIKCSTNDGPVATYRSIFKKLQQTTSPLWTAEPVYRELLSWDEEGDALSEFFAETTRASGKSLKARRVPMDIDSGDETSLDELAVLPDSDSGSDYAEERDESGDEKGAAVSPAHEQLDCPDLPCPDDTFPSATAAYCAVICAVVPVYGIGITVTSRIDTVWYFRCNLGMKRQRDQLGSACEFGGSFVLDKSTGCWRVNLRGHDSTHTHGADPRIIADPAWRPPIKHPEARVALGMDEPAVRASPRRAGLPALARDDVRSVLSSSPGKDETAAAKRRRDELQARASAGSAQLLPSTDTYDLSIDRLCAFLFALHPSLDALAIPLRSAGINSVDALVSLAHLAPDLFDSFIALIKERSAAKTKDGQGEGGEEMARITVFQVKMLAKVLRQGQDMGWPTQ